MNTIEHTITFDDSPEVKGWTSFWKFTPEMMVGMNNRFFSFKNGELYEHHIGARNEFYGVTSPTKVVVVFNDVPGDDKIFKTMFLESNQAWDVAIETNYTNSTIKSSEFNKRESRWFAFTRRNEDDTDLTATSVCGIGNVLSVTGADKFNFSNVEASVSIGDKLYRINANEKELIGVITDKNQTSVTVNAPATLNVGDFCFAAKNPRVESSSVRGYYMKAELTNNEAEPVEIFAANTKAVKSHV